MAGFSHSSQVILRSGVSQPPVDTSRPAPKTPLTDLENPQLRGIESRHDAGENAVPPFPKMSASR
jgi:hypothetical protein